MKFAMCNEFCQGWTLDDTMRLAADCGYDGIELAPFTLAPSVTDLDAAARQTIRDQAARHNLAIVGLHWLLVSPPGLSLNGPDDTLRRHTRDYFAALIRCCADLGGDRLIIGSPKQRSVLPGQTREATWDRTVALFRDLAPLAGDHGVALLIEPLARGETNFLTTAAEAVELIRAVDHPAFRLILDCKAMADEPTPIPRIIRDNIADLVHFHANDNNRSYPGTGTLDFVEILGALRDVGYADWVSIEVFDFTPPPATIARDGLAHLRRCLAS